MYKSQTIFSSMKPGFQKSTAFASNIGSFQPSGMRRSHYINMVPGELSYFSLDEANQGMYKSHMMLHHDPFAPINMSSNLEDTHQLGIQTRRTMDTLINIFRRGHSNMRSAKYGAMGRSGLISEREHVLARSSRVPGGMTQSRFNENANYVQLDRKELKRLRRSYAVAVIDEKFKPGMGRATGKARAVEIKNKINDMIDRLNKKLGIPNIA